MDSISKEIFNILKGANYQLRMFDQEGGQTLDEDSASRIYAYDQDLMITIREEDDKLEIVAQAGADFDIPDHRELMDSIKGVAHKNLGEFTVRKFSKQIQPKDFAHEIKAVTESKFSKASGTVKTSYIKLPEARIIIKHSGRVDEGKRGARSRNIHDIFIENNHGEKYMFPHTNVQGAKAMAMHINEGGNPYDSLGQHILEMCEEQAELREFMTQTRRNKMVNESNQEIISIVKEHYATNKSTLQRLSTLKGHNNFTPVSRTSLEEEGVDSAARFTYNKFTPDMSKVMERVAHIVREAKRDPVGELMAKLQELGQVSKGNFKLATQVDVDDPEISLQDNEKVRHAMMLDKLNDALDYTDKKSDADEVSNIIAQLSNDIGAMDEKMYAPMAGAVGPFIEKIVSIMNNKASKMESAPSVIDEAVSHLIRKIY